MCIKIFRKVSSSMRNTYCVTKVLFQYLEVPLSVNIRISSVMHEAIVPNRTSATKVGIQTDIRQTAVARDAYSGTKKSTSSVNHKLEGSKEKFSKDVLEYLNSKDYLKSVLYCLPQKLLKRKRSNPDALYTVDRDVAKKLVDVIALDVVKGGAPVFEVNPGLGFISRELLAAGVQRLWLSESSLAFSQQLKDLKTEFTEKIEIVNKDLFTLPKLAFQDNQDGGSRVRSLFRGVPKSEWKDDPVMKIVGVLPSLSFIKYIIQSHVFQHGVMALGRPEFYFVMTPAHYFCLTCQPGDGYFFYRSTSVLFQLIFEWCLLEKLPRTGFLPWEMKRGTKRWSKVAKVHNIDPGTMYLVKIVPRKNFFQTVVSADQLQPLWFFVRHNLISRKNRVIPQLEKWIPGCGSRFIVDGMTIFTQFGDLTPQEILTVFHKFISWPEYGVCPFHAVMETTFMRMESGIDSTGKDSDDEIEEDEES
ncbi:hypothetical protein B7P43_G15016 [Cryptotermes secundus]|uniref:rRNA adenine N(6)-methyltransferase n=1 Tax=Cryptotermes secundus TaxID=105785 RepID=A0A2J7QNZ3_9NEOP|nr:dimethyladenosine transferase 2, mitochondrial isoform X2 [Cryptotermes secundus]PNF30306.1 hypothetical protein B7P43_G15016 [Cryptotermes secundus]